MLTPPRDRALRPRTVRLTTAISSGPAVVPRGVAERVARRLLSLRRAGLVLAAFCGLACGGGAPSFGSLPVPHEMSARRAALREFGQRAIDVTLAGDLSGLVADDLALRAILHGDAASRAAALRVSGTPRNGYRARDFEVLRGGALAGVCVQNARLERASGPLGLLRDAWVFDRALVAVTGTSGERLGFWLEGSFVYTAKGFIAIAIARLEIPRWEHADLGLAPCDMDAGLR